MFTRSLGWFVCIAILMFGFSVGNLIAFEEAKASDLPNALSQAKLFSGLTDGERNALKVTATLRRGKAGERIVRQGETLDRMFIILEGAVDVRVDGEHVVTHSGQPLIGELEFLDKLPAAAEVILLNDASLIEVNYAALTALMEEQPILGYKVMREIARIEAQRLRETASK